MNIILGFNLMYLRYVCTFYTDLFDMGMVLLIGNEMGVLYNIIWKISEYIGHFGLIHVFENESSGN